MTGRTILTAVMSLVLVAAGSGVALAHGGQSMGGSGSGWFGAGPGQTGGGVWGAMGPGGSMMGGGHMGSGGSMMGNEGSQWGEGLQRLFGGNDSPAADPWKGEHKVTRDEALRVIQYRLGDNPYVRIGQETDTDQGFAFDVVTRKSGDLVDRLMVDKNTGRVFPIH